MRRFPTSSVYPSGYDEAKMAGEQSSVPSQQSPTPAAFDPSHQPDMTSLPPTSFPSLSIVRASFDSRPVNAYDWYWQDKYAQGVSIKGPGLGFLGGYTVPDGYTLILRHLSISVFPNGGEVFVAPLMTPYGDTDEGAFVSLFININGAGAPSWTQTDPINQSNVSLFDLFTGEVEIPTFVLIGSGNYLNIAIPTIISADGVALTKFNTTIRYYGNMILSTGRALVGEVGNTDPLLIRTELQG
jgi:hypothetical protein